MVWNDGMMSWYLCIVRCAVLCVWQSCRSRNKTEALPLCKALDICELAKPLRPDLQVLLFTNKDEVPPLFRALAANLGPASGAVFGAVHEREQDVMKQFKVPKVWPASIICTWPLLAAERLIKELSW